MTLSRAFLILMAAMSLIFGLAYLFAPALLTAPMGFGELSPLAQSDVRATYGGFQIGLGLFLGWCLRGGREHTGLLLVLLTIGPVLACRLIGALIDGVPLASMTGVLVFEAVLAVAAAWLVARSLRTPGRDLAGAGSANQ